MDDVIAVSVGISHDMAIISDNTLWGLGHNQLTCIKLQLPVVLLVIGL